MIKTNNLNTIKTRQKFDQTFKREAVNNWLTSGKSASVVAVELGILPNRLYGWRQPGQSRVQPPSCKPTWMRPAVRFVT